MTPNFKIGDTIKVLTRLIDDFGNPVDISSKAVRSLMKNSLVEIVGVVQKIDAHTIITTFNTSDISEGKYQTDIRFSEGTESFSTPTVIVNISKKVS